METGERDGKWWGKITRSYLCIRKCNTKFESFCQKNSHLREERITEIAEITRDKKLRKSAKTLIP